MPTAAHPESITIATGCYSRAGNGRGTGVQILTMHTDHHDPGNIADPTNETTGSTHPSAQLRIAHTATVDAPDPSFVLWHPHEPVLYAITETEPSHLLAIRTDGAAPRIIADLPLIGSGACHLAFGLDPKTIVVSHYGSGAIEVVRLDDAHRPDRSIAHIDHRTLDGGSTQPHCHQAVLLLAEGLIAVTDLGSDLVVLYRQLPDGTLEVHREIPFPPGSGPRHLAVHPAHDLLHVACELDGSVVDLRRSTGEILRRTSASQSGEPNPLSHIETMHGGCTLVVANRGPNTISVLTVGADGSSLSTETPVGEHPRHFAIWREAIWVAAQEADHIERVPVTATAHGDITVGPAERVYRSGSISCIALRSHA